MSQNQIEMENLSNADYETTITTKAPKAEKGQPEKGIPPTKPAGWSITLPNPIAGLDIQGLVDKYGAEKIEELAKANFVVRFQAAIRTMAEAGRSDEDIANTMASWKPGDRVTEKLSPEQAILKNFGNLTPEQRAELVAKLSAMGV